MNTTAPTLTSELSAAEKRALLTELLRRQAGEQLTVSPLSPGQKALWFLHHSAPESAAYHVSFSGRIHSAVDVAALKRAFQQIVDRHALLRATFHLQDGEPVQRVTGHREVSFAVHDVSGASEDELYARVDAAYRRPFDLENGPVFRVELFTRNAHDHILLMTVHHIVYDAWSLWINLDELRVLYANECAAGSGQQRSPLPSLVSGYDDYVRALQARLQGEDGEQQWAYWSKALAGDLPTLNLPLDHARPPLQSYNGASHKFALDAALAAQVKALAQAQGVTPFMLLLAAFQVLLHRYAGQDDILVGSPTMGRADPDLANVVGYFVNPVVLRADLSGNPSFEAFLGQVRLTVLEGLEHQGFPFPTLVEKLRPPRDPSTSPLFQASFVLQKERKGGGMIDSVAGSGSDGRFDWGGLDMSYYELPQQEGQFDLELELLDAGETLFGSFKYNNDVFELDTIERLGHNFSKLLSSVVTQPQARVSDLVLLDDAERHVILDQWNDTAVDYPRLGWVHDCVEHQAWQTPQATALRFGDQQLSYTDFNQRVNRLAHYLRAAGVGADVVVGVCMDRSIDLVVSLHAVLKAGGAYLPLDPEYPTDRLDYMASDADIALLLSHSNLAQRWTAEGVRRVDLDEAAHEIAAQPHHDPIVEVAPQQLAYVIYTSGSTGRPKGVAVPHAGLLNRLQWMQAQYRLSVGDTVLQKTPFSFDVSVWEFFWPLMTGATLAVAMPGDHRDSGRLVATIRQHGVTVLHFVPSMLRVFLEDAGAAQCTTIRHVFCSGEALPFDLQQRFFETQSAQLHNLYGPTEASIDVSHWTCQRQASGSTVPIGVPIANTSLYILDAQLQPQPIGVAGELHIGGIGLARGYLNQPALTADKFIRDPFGHAPGGRLYKTGDLARFRRDGAIEYLGRLDHQVKLRGFRIEIGEIESVLLTHAAVRAAVVVLREDRGDRRLVAYLAVAGSEPQPTVSELRDFLGQQLPDYMIPSAFVMLDELPLNANGKIDRKALPAPEMGRGQASSNFVPPRDSYEQTLAQLWEAALGLPSVGVQDNFFELGGHSLLAVGLMVRIEQAFGRALPMSTLFRKPTIELLAQELREQTTSPASSPLVPIQTQGTATPLFCPAGGGGSVLYYYPLAKYLGPDQPFYGLQAVGLDGSCEPLTRVEDLAAAYLQEVRTVQPHGPYRIAGHCFGGLVAFEMAQQLLRAGEAVEQLMLIDVPAGRPAGALPSDDTGWLIKLADVIRESSGHDLGLNEATLAGLNAQEQLESFRSRMVAAGFLPPGAGVAQVRGLLRVFAANGAAQYAPADVRPVPIALFRAGEFHPDYDFTSVDDAGASLGESSMGWKAYASGPVSVAVVPGNHITMMSEPHVSDLARQIGVCLSRLRAAQPA